MALLDQAQNLPQTGQPPGGEPTADPSADEPNSGPPATPELISRMQKELREKLPENRRGDLDRIITAGQRIMYAKQTRQMVARELDADVPMDKKLAYAAAGLVLLVSQESKGTMPPDMLLPAGAWLVLEAADLVLKTGREVVQQDLRDGIDQMVALVMMKAGAKQDDVMRALGGEAGQAPGAGVSQSAAPTAAPAALQPGAVQ